MRFSEDIHVWASLVTSDNIQNIEATGDRFVVDGKYGFFFRNEYFKRGPNIVVIGVPHWFLGLGMIAFAAAPWIRGSNRFSLRTLLIATMPGGYRAEADRGYWLNPRRKGTPDGMSKRNDFVKLAGQ